MDKNTNIDNTVHSLDEYQFPANSTFTLLSARKSGKSYLIRNLVYLLLKNKLIDLIYCFSYTADIDDAYGWLSKEYIFNPKKMDETIELIFKMQKQPKRRKICIICDDFDITSQSDSLDMLYTRGRHYDITTILSAQITTRGVSTSIRNNTQFLFIRKLNAKTIKDNVFQMLLNSEFDNGNELYEYVKNNNENHQFILYLNDDRPVSDSIAIVKAKEVKFKFEYHSSKKSK
jgi:hypothetical protein